MKSRTWSALGLLATLGAGAGSVYLLHKLGSHLWMAVDWQHPGGWLDVVPVEWALAAIARLLGLAIGYWLVASSSLYILARLLRLPAAVRSIGWATLPVVRRLADRIVMTGLAAASLVAPAPLLVQAAPSVVPTTTPETIAPGYVPVPAGRTPPTIPDPSTTAPINTTPITTTVPPAPVSDQPAADQAAGTPPPRERMVVPTEVRVVHGDHLWVIAERHLVAVWDRPAADHEIAPYWLKVIEANRARLRSGNPDLIYPGEVIVLPTI